MESRRQEEKERRSGKAANVETWKESSSEDEDKKRKQQRSNVKEMEKVAKSELKGCNRPLIWLALNHKGMLGNQCRLIATFTSAENTETNCPLFLVLYLQLFLYLSLPVTHNPAVAVCSVYWENIRRTQLNSHSEEKC